jgi:O-antigen ligase
MTVQKQELSTTGARMIIWDLSWDIIAERPVFGSGTGDVKDDLMVQYKKNEYHHLFEHQLNAHNEFIQMLIAIGVVGCIIFLLYIFYPLTHSDLFGNIVYLGFILIIFFNFMTESMLETQAGVVFYAFFNALFYFNRDKITSFSINRSK